MSRIDVDYPALDTPYVSDRDILQAMTRDELLARFPDEDVCKAYPVGRRPTVLRVRHAASSIPPSAFDPIVALRYK
jgi:hypothetical protein